MQILLKKQQGLRAGALDLKVQIQVEVLETILKDHEDGLAVVSASMEMMKEGRESEEEWGAHVSACIQHAVPWVEMMIRSAKAQQQMEKMEHG